MTLWLKRNKWKLVRRAVQLGVLLLLVSPVFGLAVFRGTMLSGELLGVTLNDPLAALDYTLAAKTVSLTVLGGALVVLIFYYLIGGRTFCSWVCPVHLVSEIGGKLGGRSRLFRTQVPPTAKYWVLIVVLALSLLTSLPVFELISPIGAITQNLSVGAAAGGLVNASLLLVLLVFIGELLGGKGWWCGAACPVAAVYAIVGRWSGPRMRIDHDACNSCGDCFRVCMVPDVLHAPVNKKANWVLSGDCSNCLDCVDACTEDALRLGFSFTGRK